MIRQGDRVLATGATGSGKSQALAYLFANHTGQRLLIDVGDAYELGPAALDDEAGACVADRVRSIDWRARTIRYVPRTLAEREYNELYSAIFQRGSVLVWLDEAYGPTTQHRTPLNLRRTITQGRKRGITHLHASQRPAGIDRTLVNQSEHTFAFLTADPDDLKALSFRFGTDARSLAELWADKPADRLWEAGYVYHRLGSNELRRMPPMPADYIEHAQRHVVIPS